MIKSQYCQENILYFQEFCLKHYAGDVTYNVDGFLDKNNDLLFRDLREVMSETTNSITKVCPVLLM
jgi:myosin-1